MTKYTYKYIKDMKYRYRYLKVYPTSLSLPKADVGKIIVGLEKGLIGQLQGVPAHPKDAFLLLTVSESSDPLLFRSQLFPLIFFGPTALFLAAILDSRALGRTHMTNMSHDCIHGVYSCRLSILCMVIHHDMVNNQPGDG